VTLAIFYNVSGTSFIAVYTRLSMNVIFFLSRDISARTHPPFETLVTSFSHGKP